ncbi:MAG: SAM-dependent methyltransferase, partial [Clostridiales bacterium]|nr:SAM-dependent methyltransferase [Clostridiales bacterium]
VPCCQHELNSQIQTERFSLLTRYGIIKERFSALATDAIRANLLEACGYKTQLLEFIDLSHTPKNILIRAVKRDGTCEAARKKYLLEAKQLMEEFHFQPTFYRLLHQAERIE